MVRETNDSLLRVRSNFPYHLHNHGCSSLACKVCRSRVAELLCTRLRSSSEKTGFLPRYMLTLTVGRDKTASEVYQEVTSKRSISELMRKIRSLVGDFRWFSMLEFQEGGYPHWHILLDINVDLKWGKFANEVGKRFFKLIHSFWSYGSHINLIRIYNPVASFRYVTKYLCPKDEKHEVPDWALDLPRVRFFSACRGFWGELSHRKVLDFKDDSDEHDSFRRSSLRKRLESCCINCDVFLGRNYVGTLKGISSERLKDWYPKSIMTMYYSRDDYNSSSSCNFVHLERFWDFLQASNDGRFLRNEWSLDFARDNRDFHWLESWEYSVDPPNTLGCDFWGFNRYNNSVQILV